MHAAGPVVTGQVLRAEPRWTTLAAQGVVTENSGGHLISAPLQALILRVVLTDFILDIAITRSSGDQEEYADRGCCLMADGLLARITLFPAIPT